MLSKQIVHTLALVVDVTITAVAVTTTAVAAIIIVEAVTITVTVMITVIVNHLSQNLSQYVQHTKSQTVILVHGVSASNSQPLLTHSDKF